MYQILHVLESIQVYWKTRRGLTNHRRLNELINQAVYRTALATPGLLITMCTIQYKSKHVSQSPQLHVFQPTSSFISLLRDSTTSNLPEITPSAQGGSYTRVKEPLRCFQGVSKSSSTSLSRSRVLAARSCPACRHATTSCSQSPPPSPSTPRSQSSLRSTCILSLSIPLSLSLPLSPSPPPSSSLSLSIPALRLHPLSLNPSFPLSPR